MNLQRNIEVAPRRERLESALEKFTNLTRQLSVAVNEGVERQFGIPKLLNPDASIAMEGFGSGYGAPYSREQIVEDLETNLGSEVSFSGAYNFSQGSLEQKAKIDEWREIKERSRANQIEMAITVLFHRILKDSFLVVRAATYDDYGGSTDNLLVDKTTGEVLCAIDDVHTDDSGRTDIDANRGKAEKVKKIAERGGSKVKYGLTMEKGKLKRAGLQNVPVFYLGLITDQLKLLSANMSQDISAPVSEVEKQIFSEMVKSLEEQKNILSALNLKSGIRNNLTKLGPTLERLKQISSSPLFSEQEPLPIAA